MGLFRRNTNALDVDALVTNIVDQVKAALPATPETRQDVDVFGPGAMFGPGIPLVPQTLDPRTPMTGVLEPRRSEYQTSSNLLLTDDARLEFKTLRDVADRVDLIRRCIETRKSQMVALDWDITLSKQAIRRVMLENNLDTPSEAAQIARQVFTEDIARCRDWWENPDPINQMDWPTWLGAMLEEHLVLDALSINPRRKLSGDLAAFEIIDGATIKPLLDLGGRTPMPPAIAYQQILFGFPRGEWTASPAGEVANEYKATELIYRPRIRRSFTPYGYSDTESALSAADIYLKRVGWIRDEFDEGTDPKTWLTPPETSKMQPDQVLAWETAINDQNAGVNRERFRMRITPPGFTPKQMTDFSQLYKPELDEFLVKLVCAAFSVMPTEIGFPPGGGIGGKGHQEGESNSSARRARKPTAMWIESVITSISRRYLRMPPELKFSLLGWEIEDQESDEKVADSQIRRAGLTINEDRAARGLPLFKFKEADTPFLVTGSGVVFLEGAIEAQAAAAGAPQTGVPGVPAQSEDPAGPPPAPSADPVSATDPRPGDEPKAGDPIAPDEPVPDGFVRVQGHLRAKPKPAAQAEAQKFLRYVERRHGRTWRPFEFEHIDKAVALELNEAGMADDVPAIRSILVANLGKARARRVSRAAKAKLIADHKAKISAALRGLFPPAGLLIDGWQDRVAATKNTDTEQHAAHAFVSEQLYGVDFDDVDDELDDYLTAGHSAAWDAASVDDFDEDPEDVDEDGKPTRLGRLLSAVPELRTTLVAGVVTAVAGALLSDDPDSALGVVFDDHAESFAADQLTDTLTAGTLDATEAQGIELVRIVATPECEFCAGYEGRIMHLDDDSGMPPLHRGCQCDIEPLPPDEEITES